MLADVLSAERVIGAFGIRDTVGVALAEYSLREVLTGNGFYFAALDRELLATLCAVNSDLSFGEGGAEDNLLDNLGGLLKEFLEGAEGYI